MRGTLRRGRDQERREARCSPRGERQRQLREARRYVVVGAFIVAAVLTPPDVISQFMLAIPLMLLYELGIYLAGFIAARSRAPDDPDAATPTPEVPTKTD